MLDSAELMHLMLMNTIGMSILVQTFKTASLFVYPRYQSNPNSRYKESRECFAFIQGTGLEMLLMSYGLNYDAENLRESFNWYVRHKT